MLRPSGKKRSDGKGGSDYATHSDFCAVFLQDLDRLCLLALILTGDELRVEGCLLAALDSCEQRDRVFRQSAVSWCRRSVIKATIRSMSPAPWNSSRPYLVGNRSDPGLDQDASLKCIQELPPFDRFVFVMSVLERYSDRECALLLGCSCADIPAARIGAFQQMSARLSKGYAGHSGGGHYVVDADWLECG
jgi:hypothetical protein